MSSTNHNSFVTSYQRISSESLLTRTNGAMITNFTECILATCSNTRVSTVEVETCQVMWALMVILALPFLTRDKWVTLETSWTFACCCASCRDALCIGSTWVGVAWVWLLLAPCDGVRHGDIPSDTLAHGVSQSVDIAPGVGSTWAWEAWVWGWCSGLNLTTACDGIWLWGVS